MFALSFLISFASAVMNVWKVSPQPFCIVANDYVPTFDVVATVLGGLREFRLPDIPFDLELDGWCSPEEASDPLGNRLEFVLRDTVPGQTVFWVENRTRRNFHMTFSTNVWYRPTFYTILLHELGHVYGLDHPDPPSNSIMGLVLRKPNGVLLQMPHNYHLTALDVYALYRYYYELDPNQVTNLLASYFRIISLFPANVSIQDQKCIT